MGTAEFAFRAVALAGLAMWCFWAYALFVGVKELWSSFFKSRRRRMPPPGGGPVRSTPRNTGAFLSLWATAAYAALVGLALMSWKIGDCSWMSGQPSCSHLPASAANFAAGQFFLGSINLLLVGIPVALLLVIINGLTHIRKRPA